MEFEQRLDRYAEVVVKIGLNIQPNQPLSISAPLETADLVRAVARKAYEAGARRVEVEWADDILSRMRFELAPEDSFQEFPKWRVQQADEMIDQGGAYLFVSGSDPDLLKGIDSARIGTWQKVAHGAMQRFHRATTTMKVSWLICAAPTDAWAARVFPEVPAAERISRLWDAIFEASRVSGEDPAAQWAEHIQQLHQRAAKLNDMRLQELHYRSTQTDLTVELPQGHLWIAAASKNDRGISFVPNIPTEEVFTMPKKDGVNGVVHSTRPLSYAGTLIEDFSLTFENGRIVDFQAQNGREALEQLIATDEGSHFLGEVALVPYESPISQQGVLFYNTLFDENASCHLAIGNVIEVCIEGGGQMSPDQLQAKGANQSLTHVDFMMGSADMDIDGTTPDGRVIPIFRQGNWAL
ncbi:aminopeptidase [Alicyclobacillus sp. ALC3]|uniref:aminopeptidase n=1 Tax=Alicyclobacillus sp. ALC3 TaxID=2796143 RepID=UPI002379B6CC|nr:aminopeptidase [Alicyclobacillus sp. ALC3]WDL98240.1 aminopeptidase [Alicyclobacillus sp. ALC3]